MAFGVCTNSTSQKWKFLQKFFFDIVTTHNDEISYLKHVSAPLYVFFDLFGFWGGGLPRGPGQMFICFMHVSNRKVIYKGDIDQRSMPKNIPSLAPKLLRLCT